MHVIRAIVSGATSSQHFRWSAGASIYFSAVKSFLISLERAMRNRDCGLMTSTPHTDSEARSPDSLRFVLSTVVILDYIRHYGEGDISGINLIRLAA